MLVKKDTPTWTKIVLRGNKPGLDNVKVTLTPPPGLDVVYPGDASAAGLNNGPTLAVAEDDFISVRLTATGLDPEQDLPGSADRDLHRGRLHRLGPHRRCLKPPHDLRPEGDLHASPHHPRPVSRRGRRRCGNRPLLGLSGCGAEHEATAEAQQTVGAAQAAPAGAARTPQGTLSRRLRRTCARCSRPCTTTRRRWRRPTRPLPPTPG
ncbi:hypothetical protein KRMM14A1259_45890 [Krasilnikovia sp. MM14-A1259]